MKVATCFTLLFLGISVSSANPLDRVLKTIEFLITVKPGVFSCVFYDVTPQHNRNNIVDVLLKSSRLTYTSKYVLTNANRENVIRFLPWRPSLLLIYAGNNVTHLQLDETIIDFSWVLYSFDPSTKVLVLVESIYSPVMKEMKGFVTGSRYVYSAFMDSSSKKMYQCNGEYYFRRPKNQHPMYVFSWKKRWLQGRDITYIETYDYRFAWHVRWLNETARYLNTKAVEFPHNCRASKEAYFRCAEKHHDSAPGADILLHGICFAKDIPMLFQYVFTSLMLSSRFLVPRDRPLNIAELMVMPFHWHVWTLIVLIFTLAEIIKVLFPEKFKNNPILLVVCGFERHDLHQAGRWEKISFLSLIILMFFLSNAFETKMVSLMVSKPSVQNIKTIEDLRRSGLKIYADLENYPYFVNDTLVGSIMVQGDNFHALQTDAKAALRRDSDWVDAVKDLAYDFERKQPFYVLIDGLFYDSPEVFECSFRNPIVPYFHFIHITLEEAGIMNLWKRQDRDSFRFKILGRRPRMHINDKAVLNLGHMKPAWLILGIGLSIGFVGFILELLKN